MCSNLFNQANASAWNANLAAAAGKACSGGCGCRLHAWCCVLPHTPARMHHHIVLPLPVCSRLQPTAATLTRAGPARPQRPSLPAQTARTSRLPLIPTYLSLAAKPTLAPGRPPWRATSLGGHRVRGETRGQAPAAGWLAGCGGGRTETVVADRVDTSCKPNPHRPHLRRRHHRAHPLALPVCRPVGPPVHRRAAPGSGADVCAVHQPLRPRQRPAVQQCAGLCAHLLRPADPLQRCLRGCAPPAAGPLQCLGCSQRQRWCMGSGAHPSLLPPRLHFILLCAACQSCYAPPPLGPGCTSNGAAFTACNQTACACTGGWTGPTCSVPA